jgi:hypothetical protein
MEVTTISAPTDAIVKFDGATLHFTTVPKNDSEPWIMVAALSFGHGSLLVKMQSGEKVRYHGVPMAVGYGDG